MRRLCWGDRQRSPWQLPEPRVFQQLAVPGTVHRETRFATGVSAGTDSRLSDDLYLMIIAMKGGTERRVTAHLPPVISQDLASSCEINGEITQDHTEFTHQ